MKRSTSPPRKRTNSAIAVIIACMTAFAPSLSLAANATLNVGYSGVTPATAPSVIIPKQAGTTSTTYSPVFKGIQTSTELDATRSQPAEAAPAATQPAETTPGAAPAQAAPAAKPLPQIGIGMDAIMNDDLQIYTIPISYAFSRNFSIQVNIPIVTAKFDDINGASSTNVGFGDVGLTLKHRMGSENGIAALYSLVTAKFASGDANRGLGTGTYDLSLTEKVVKRIGNFRGTIMGGVTQPINKPTVLGSKVEYGTTISFMAALEHTVILPDLWFSARAEGMHAFETRIDDQRMGNALTTLDMAPEFKYYFKRNTSINLGATVPVYTDYALKGGSNSRKVAASFGVSTMF